MILLILLPCLQSLLIDSLSGADMAISLACYYNKHPCLPTTFDCSQQFYAVSISFESSIKELLTMIDPNYVSWVGMDKSVQGVQGGALFPRPNAFYGYVSYPSSSRFYSYLSAPTYSKNSTIQGWVTASQTAAGQYLVFGSSVPYQFDALTISGKPEYSGQYILSFTITYSLDGTNWTGYKGNSIIATGFVNQFGIITIVLVPFTARAVKITQITWLSWSGALIEWYISKPVYNKLLPSGSLIAAISCGFHIVASSNWDTESSESKISSDLINRVGFASWCAGVSDNNQWIVISSAVPVEWRSITTYGGNDSSNQWIKSYFIMYSTDMINWISYQNNATFNGNTDKITAISNTFTPFVAYAIRVHPVSWNNLPCARMEVYCTEV